MALIIVEGPDCTGKSTFVKLLEKELSARTHGAETVILHAGPLNRHPLDEYEEPLFDYRPGETCNYIIDRWHWGERVYPTVLNRRTIFDPAMFMHTEMFLRCRGAFMVHITSGVHNINNCIAKRGDELVNSSQTSQIVELFKRVERQSILPKVRLNLLASSQETEPATAAGIADSAVRTEMEYTTLNPFVTYIGPRWPRVLLLGDVRGGDHTTHGLRPAFMPKLKSSGHYLMQSIADNLGDVAMDIGVANANDVDDIVQLWHKLGQPRVIALGTRAMGNLPEEMKHHQLYHPQYVRRFLRKTMTPQAYAAEIRNRMGGR